MYIGITYGTCANSSTLFCAETSFVRSAAPSGTLDSCTLRLAKKTLEHTDWQVDEDDSDLLIQTVPETIYTCTVGSSFSARNLDTNTTVTIGANETIYILIFHPLSRYTTITANTG